MFLQITGEKKEKSAELFKTPYSEQKRKRKLTSLMLNKWKIPQRARDQEARLKNNNKNLHPLWSTDFN